MKLHRFIGEFNLDKKTLKLTNLDIINQIRNVLRLNVGDRFVLCDNHLQEAVVKITDLNKEEINAEVIKKEKNGREPKHRVSLYCSILKRENFELVAQKATEVGVVEIIPVISERTVKLGLKQDRLKKIIKEAAEQSGRGMVPKLRGSLNYEDALKDAVQNTEKAVIFDADGTGIKNISFAERNNTAIFIGPEGGWSDKELETAKNAGLQVASLGKFTLRAETAAAVASFLTVNA